MCFIDKTVDISVYYTDGVGDLHYVCDDDIIGTILCIDLVFTLPFFFFFLTRGNVISCDIHDGNLYLLRRGDIIVPDVCISLTVVTW